MFGDANSTQTLTDHLGELRDRLIKTAWAIMIGAIGCWFIAEQILEAISAPIRPFLPNGKLVFLNPTDMFMAHVKIAVMGGIVFACPVWLYQLWMFVAPGLYSHERKYSVLFIGSGTLLFLVGVGFAYFLVLPAALQFLLTFGAGAGSPMITLPEYLSFFLTMAMVFGASFELPLVIVLLGAIGLVDQKFLRSKRRFAIVILAALSAIITPPDVLSMLMLLVPLCILYEISILLVGMIGKRRAPAPV